MINRNTFLRTTLAAGLVAATLAGCGMMRPSNKIDIYEARMSGVQEVPPAATQASGNGEFLLNTNTNTLSWKVTYSGLSGEVTGAHIHGPAAMGANAGVMVPFTGNLNAQPIQGEKQLTAVKMVAGIVLAKEMIVGRVCVIQILNPNNWDTAYLPFRRPKSPSIIQGA